jgi:hypothetical protein
LLVWKKSSLEGGKVNNAVRLSGCNSQAFCRISDNRVGGAEPGTKAAEGMGQAD